jgi:hypothetical protein
VFFCPRPEGRGNSNSNFNYGVVMIFELPLALASGVISVHGLKAVAIQSRGNSMPQAFSTFVALVP